MKRMKRRRSSQSKIIEAVDLHDSEPLVPPAFPKMSAQSCSPASCSHFTAV
jgi:hypothetical protein